MSTKQFQNKVRSFYKKHGRTLPWRKTKNPYKILVSELMLQQTQVDRVIPKYNAFIKRFPTLTSLKEARLRDVLLLWQGLGYNRRAKYLYDIACTNRALPRTFEGLQKLSGVGPYTAAAIMNFAYNTPTPMIETNIRSAYLHHFFENESNVDDKDVFEVIEKTIDIENPKEWFNALMDYGAYIKTTKGNPNRKSKQYAKQSSFKGSKRELRGKVLKLLTKTKRVSKRRVYQLLESKKHDISEVVKDLEKEHLISCKSGWCTIYTSDTDVQYSR